MPQIKPDKNTRVLKDAVTGALIAVPAAEADERAQREGLQYATLQEIDKWNEREKFGSAGQTALGAVELAGEAATLGLYHAEGDAADARRRVLRRESPVTAFAAEAAGTLAPGLVGGGLAAGAARTLGASARVGAITSAVAEGGLSGFAQEQVVAREEGRDIDPGNVFLYGVGGEVAGRLVPKALGGGLQRAAARAEDALGGSADNMLVRAEQRASASGSDVAHAAPGPERDRFLRDNATELYSSSSETVRRAMDRSTETFHELGDLSKKRGKIGRLVSAPHPGQDRWILEQVSRLETALDEVEAYKGRPGLTGASEKIKTTLDDSIAELTGSRIASERFIAADKAKRALQAWHVTLGRGRMTAQDKVYHDSFMSIVDELQEGLRRGLEDESIWGRAAKFQADINSAWSNRWFRGAQVTESDLARVTGREFDATPTLEFDPAKIRSFLQKDKTGRGLTAEKLEQVLEGYQEMAEAHRKWGLTSNKQLDQLQSDIADVRKAIADADEIGSAIPRADKADAAERASDQLVTAALPVVGGAYVATKRALKNIQTAGASSIRAAAHTMVNGVRNVGKGFSAASRVGGPVGVVAAGHLRERQPVDTRFKGDYPTLTQSFQAKRQQIVTAIQEPESLVMAMADGLGDLHEAAPVLHTKLVARMVQAVTYLSQNMPPGIENSLLSKHATPPDVQSIREFARLWEAVMDPGAVIQDFATMQATPAQARALQAVHPDLFQQLQGEALAAIAESPRRPAWERLRYMDQMFQLGAALGSVWKPEAARNIRNAIQNAPANPEQLKNSPLETSPDNPRGIASIASGPTYSS